jgi:DNA-binding transcriptional ArsR family regulator
MAAPAPLLHPTGVGTRSLDRGLTLAKVVAFAPHPLTFSEVAEIADLPKSTAFRLLGALQRGGLVERDDDGRYHTGWLLHGLRQPGTSVLRHELTSDPEFLGFLSERLTEEIVATTHRRMMSSDPGARIDPGLEVLHELLQVLRRGELPDDTTLQLLTQAYADHPDFHEEWRRPQQYAARLARRRG